MLYANKQDVEADLSVQLLQIRERELKFYSSNCRTIGTQASVFAGFAFSFFEVAARFEGYAVIEEVRHSNITKDTLFERANKTPEALRVLFVLSATCAMALNVSAMFFANCLALLGPGLALRGDGSAAMDRAVDGLALEYRVVFLVFFCGIVSFFVVALMYSLMQADWVLSACVVLVLVYLLRHSALSFKRLYKKFRLPPALAQSGAFNPVDGSLMMDPVVQAAQVAALSRHAQWLERLSQRKRVAEWPIRQYLYVRLFFDDFVGVSSEVFELRYAAYASGTPDEDGIARVILRAIEEQRAHAAEPVHTTRNGSRHNGHQRASGSRASTVGDTDELAAVSMDPARRVEAAADGPTRRRRPWDALRRVASHGGGDGGRGLLSAGALPSDAMGGSPASACAARSSAMSIEWSPHNARPSPHAPRGADPLRRLRAPGGGDPGPSAPVGRAGFASPYGRVDALSPTASDDRPPAGGRKRWDLGGWLVDTGETWLQRL
jgi:hypothetical protein